MYISAFTILQFLLSNLIAFMTDRQPILDIITSASKVDFVSSRKFFKELLNTNNVIVKYYIGVIRTVQIVYARIVIRRIFSTCLIVILPNYKKCLKYINCVILMYKIYNCKISYKFVKWFLHRGPTNILHPSPQNFAFIILIIK